MWVLLRRRALFNTRKCSRFYVRYFSLQDDHQQQSTPDALKNFKLWQQPSGFDTGIRIYNTICREKVPLIIKKKNLLTWYSCGPTVYEEAHIGHAFCYVKFDIIRRILQDFFNIDVIFQMGITDIDDKIIKRSLEEKLNFQVIAKKYEAEFLNELSKLNVLPPVILTRVTEFIPNIVAFIEKLIELKIAYKTSSGGVNFDTTAYGGYGKFKPFITETHVESDIVDQTEKKSIADFALWKPTKPNEPWWESPWGRGRPGWHIECSAMASSTFGSNIDIHSGGIDLMYPHHEDEMAQSEAYHCCNQWINYWLHSGHVHWNDQKMSKSLRNIISIKDFLKDFTGNDFRIFCLRSSLRRDVNYTEDIMKDAKITYEKLASFQILLSSYLGGSFSSGRVNESSLLSSLHKTKEGVVTALQDDFNTSLALNCLMDLISSVNKELLSYKGGPDVRSPAAVAAVLVYVNKILSNFGISLPSSGMRTPDIQSSQGEESLIPVINSAVNFRQEVRQIALQSKSESSEGKMASNKMLLKLCDEMRENMNNVGIKIKDHSNYSTWTFHRRLEE